MGSFESKPVLSPLFGLLLEALCIISHSVKPSPHRWVFFVLIATIVICCALFTRISLGISLGNEAWEMGQANFPMIRLFDASTNILLTEPQRQLRYIAQKDLEISRASLSSRFRWGVRLWASPRGIGFTHEPTAHLPPRPKQRTRRAFILSQLRSITVYLILFDLTGIMNRANPYWTKDIPVVSGNQRVWRLASFGYALVLYTSMTIGHKIVSIISVLAGFSEPREWPDFFGSLFDAYTVRRVWGKVWHQMFRRMALVHADFFAQKLSLPPHAKYTRIFKLYAAFLVSGLMHYGGDALLLQNASTTGAIRFFLLQATAIMFETVVSTLACRAGLIGPRLNSNLAYLMVLRLLGYLWVIVWMAFSLPMWIDPLYRYGFTDSIPTFSPILWMWRRAFIT
ncbi:hypothetical protein M413DRAFT_126297 [Hebeloma cylindrosporum]|uniref:Wax synthase domain-containing protein n=1 Tax=Hebeloma cylindrosporum TaxID=76867 RepID=A0A0C3BRM3_HEBCY|nr:hypothetical protein M413DRAFT_450106 [Hebeloma cylindrosporum h7]KIM34699.1 hypothetical protein M413DRAFT_126297 [Hebeloma cylindrosporum h7]